MSKSKAKAITRIDPTEAHRITEERCSSIDRNAKFSTSELLNHLQKFESNLGNKDEQLLYTWRRSGIITASKGKKGEIKEVDFYPYNEIRKATMASYLWGKNVPPAEIAGAIAFWGNYVLKENREFTIDIAEVERAKVILGSRLLALVTGIILETYGPPTDTLIICQSSPHMSGMTRNENNLALFKCDSQPKLVPNEMLIGYATKRPEAEVLIRINDINDIIPRMAGRKYYNLRITSPQLENGNCEIILGIPEDPTDERAKKLIQAHNLGILPCNLSQDSWDLLCKILNYIFQNVMVMPNQFIGNDLRYRLSMGGDHLEALTTAIILANKSWSSCAFFIKEKNGLLHLRSNSPSYPAHRGLSLSFNPQHNLESWVFETGEYITIQDVLEQDPRIPVSGRHVGASPFALIPAISNRQIEGVVYISGSMTEVHHDFNSNITFLHVLASILGEVYARQSLVNVDHLVSPSLPLIGQYQGEGHLQETLKTILKKRIARPNTDSVDSNANIVLFAIQVNQDTNLKDVRDWYEKQLCRRISHFLQRPEYRRKHSFASKDVKVFRFGKGNLVGLVEGMALGADFSAFRKQLQENIQAFCTAHKGIEAYIWSVQFSYSNLRNLLVDYVEVEEQVKAILDHLNRALRNAKFLSDADHNLKGRNFEKALVYYRMALIRRNGELVMDSYVFRHLSEVYGYLNRWEMALEFADKAIAADRVMNLPGYAGSHLRRAEALIGLKKFDEGIKEFEKAAIMSQELKYQVAYIKASILYGNDDNAKIALEKIDNLLRRNYISEKEKSWLCILRYRINKKLNQESRRAQVIESLEMAVEFDRENPYALWELEQNITQSSTFVSN